ncbi:hypothetical protein CR513_43333, partial [Mucuna pruriens]
MHLKHIIKARISILSKHDFLSDQKIEKLNFCVHCVYKKQIGEPIDCIHYNVYDPMFVLSKGGARYLLIFINGTIIHCIVQLTPEKKKRRGRTYEQNSSSESSLNFTETKPSKFRFNRDVKFHKSSILHLIMESRNTEKEHDINK